MLDKGAGRDWDPSGSAPATPWAMLAEGSIERDEFAAPNDGDDEDRAQHSARKIADGVALQ